MSLEDHPDTYREILKKLDDKSLGRICQTDKYAKKICGDDIFWYNRIIDMFNIKSNEVLEAKLKNETYKEFYTSSRFFDFKNKIYPMCLDLLKIPKLSQMVIDDFYNPTEGFVSAAFTRDIDGMTYLLLKIVLERYKKDGLEYKEIEDLIVNAKNKFEDYRSDQFDTNTFELTEKEKILFQRLIDIPIPILRSSSKIRPSFFKNLKNPEEIFKLIAFIHKGFTSGQLPFDIKWDELCTHPYLFEKFVY